jgi:hypothetical protein
MRVLRRAHCQQNAHVFDEDAGGWQNYFPNGR